MSDSDQEKFNEFQKKVGDQIESLAKEIFVLSGLALTLSIGLFNSPIGLEMCESTKAVLAISWGCFFLAIATLVISISLMVLENYRFGKKWLIFLKSAEIPEGKTNFSFERYCEISLVIGVVSFLLGIIGLCYVAVNILR